MEGRAPSHLSYTQVRDSVPLGCEEVQGFAEGRARSERAEKDSPSNLASHCSNAPLPGFS